MSDCGDADVWVPCREREEWRDVRPVKQDDGEHSVVQIAYSDKYKDAHDYFRAVLQLDERSERALWLTELCIELNAANYTVWHFRRLCLQALKKDLQEELKYISSVITEHPKNYQVWYHRQMIVDWLKDPAKELDFTAHALKEDAKNYHAWQHRQWVMETFSLWDQELEFVDQLLEDDLRNNSAWNQRYYAISNTTGFTDEVVAREVKYAQGFISKAPNNESPWNYLKGLFLSPPRSMCSYPGLMQYCAGLREHGCSAPYLFAFLVDCHEQQLQQGACPDRQAALDTALQLCEDLAVKYDVIRREYWWYFARTLTQRFGGKTADQPAPEGATAPEH